MGADAGPLWPAMEVLPSMVECDSESEASDAGMPQIIFTKHVYDARPGTNAAIETSPIKASGLDMDLPSRTVANATIEAHARRWQRGSSFSSSDDETLPQLRSSGTIGGSHSQPPTRGGVTALGVSYSYDPDYDPNAGADVPEKVSAAVATASAMCGPDSDDDVSSPATKEGDSGDEAEEAARAHRFSEGELDRRGGGFGSAMTSPGKSWLSGAAGRMVTGDRRPPALEEQGLGPVDADEAAAWPQMQAAEREFAELLAEEAEGRVPPGPMPATRRLDLEASIAPWEGHLDALIARLQAGVVVAGSFPSRADLPPADSLWTDSDSEAEDTGRTRERAAGGVLADGLSASGPPAIRGPVSGTPAPTRAECIPTGGLSEGHAAVLSAASERAARWRQEMAEMGTPEDATPEGSPEVDRARGDQAQGDESLMRKLFTKQGVNIEESMIAIVRDLAAAERAREAQEGGIRPMLTATAKRGVAGRGGRSSRPGRGAMRIGGIFTRGPGDSSSESSDEDTEEAAGTALRNGVSNGLLSTGSVGGGQPVKEASNAGNGMVASSAPLAHVPAAVPVHAAHWSLSSLMMPASGSLGPDAPRRVSEDPEAERRRDVAEAEARAEAAAAELERRAAETAAVARLAEEEAAREAQSRVEAEQRRHAMEAQSSRLRQSYVRGWENAIKRRLAQATGGVSLLDPDVSFAAPTAALCTVPVGVSIDATVSIAVLRPSTLAPALRWALQTLRGLGGALQGLLLCRREGEGRSAACTLLVAVSGVGVPALHAAFRHPPASVAAGAQPPGLPLVAVCAGPSPVLAAPLSLWMAGPQGAPLDPEAETALTGLYGPFVEDASLQDALLVAVDRAAEVGLDVVGLRTVYAQEQDHRHMHSHTALRDASMARDDVVVALALRARDALRTWRSALGPSAPDLARHTDAQSVHARIACARSPFRSVFTAASCARELSALFGGWVDLRQDPEGWMREADQGVPPREPFPPKNPFVTQPSASPGTSQQTGASPALVHALCPSPLERRLICFVPPSRGDPDLLNALAAIAPLQRLGFSVTGARTLAWPANLDARLRLVRCGHAGEGTGDMGLPVTAGALVVVAEVAREGASDWIRAGVAAAGDGAGSLYALVDADGALLVDHPTPLAEQLASWPSARDADAFVSAVAEARDAMGLPRSLLEPAQLCGVVEVAVAVVACKAEAAEVLRGAMDGLRVVGWRVTPLLPATARKLLVSTAEGRHGDAGALRARARLAAAAAALRGPVVVIAVAGVDAHSRLLSALDAAHQALAAGTVEGAGTSILAVSKDRDAALAALSRLFRPAELQVLDRDMVSASGCDADEVSVVEMVAGGKLGVAVCCVRCGAPESGPTVERVMRMCFREQFRVRWMGVRTLGPTLCGLLQGGGSLAGETVLGMVLERQNAAPVLASRLATGGPGPAAGLLGKHAFAAGSPSAASEAAYLLTSAMGVLEVAGYAFESAECPASRLLERTVLVCRVSGEDFPREGGDSVLGPGPAQCEGASLQAVGECLEALLMDRFSLLDCRLCLLPASALLGGGIAKGARERGPPGSQEEAQVWCMVLALSRDNAVTRLRMACTDFGTGALGDAMHSLAHHVAVATSTAESAEFVQRYL